MSNKCGRESKASFIIAMCASVTLALSYLTACSPLTLPSEKESPNWQQPPSRIPTSNQSAVLDWNSATIVLPLDRFGMSLREQQIVQSARLIVFARCVDKSGKIGSEVVNGVRQYLRGEPDANHWLFGYWNAKYLARMGFQSIVSHLPGLVEADADSVECCINDPDYVNLEVISVDFQTTTGVSDSFMRWSFEAFEKTVIDDRFVALRSELAKCVTQAGEKEDIESRLGGVFIDTSWEEERVLKAFMVEANCNDRLNFTQQIADIDAAYQGEYIISNGAELVEIRKIAQSRVEFAQEILNEEGLA